MPAESPEDTLRELLEGNLEADDPTNDDGLEKIIIKTELDDSLSDTSQDYEPESSKYCSVMGCTLSSSTYSTYKGTTFHLLPKDPELSKKWIEAVGGEQYLKKHDQIRICSFHFRATCFNRCGSNSKLKPGSLPSINIPFKQAAPVWPAAALRANARAQKAHTSTAPPAQPATTAKLQPHWAKPIVTKVEGVKTQLLSPPPITRMITRPKTGDDSHLKFQLDLLMKRSALIRCEYEKQLQASKQNIRMLKKKVAYQHKQIMALKLRLNRFKEDKKETKKMEDKCLFMYRNGRLVRMEFNNLKKENEVPGKKKRGRKPKNSNNNNNSIEVIIEEEEDEMQEIEYTIETEMDDSNYDAIVE